MNTEFWHAKWRERSIGFHQLEINGYLQRHVQALSLAEGDHILVPLCGKSRDMVWLAQQGYQVAGVELSEIAVREFFVDYQQAPDISTIDGIQCFQAEKVQILCGDFFDIQVSHLPAIPAIYDRAALIALPREMRKPYVEHLSAFAEPGTMLLLITLEYPLDALVGPPFCVWPEEVTSLFEGCARVEEVQTETIEFKGLQCTERVWLIQW